ncbi:trypsin-like peptidase domain-containing protein [Promicromonospora sp. NPDC023987]|uniref:nSTAND1 domain-containing NTPase n=1 Tax=Promicromonospora sp. NPDC023987 TaxID=3155360 RepID=UPI0033E68811
MTDEATGRPLDAGRDMAPLLRSILTVRRGNDVVGMAYLVSESLAVTCSHVVNLALGTERSADVTGESVQLGAVFVNRAGAAVPATVEHWAAETRPRSAADDIAVLRLDHVIDGTAPAPLEHPSWQERGARVRAFGMTAQHGDGVWHDATVEGAVASGWIQLNQGSAVGHRIDKGFSGGPVWDPVRQTVVGMVTAADLGSVPAAAAIPASTLLDVLAPYDESARLARPSPFPGLAPYQEHMRAEFLGRDADAAAVFEKLTQYRRTTILGPSGHGKSSLALAGVVPLFREAGYDVVTVRPSLWPSGTELLPRGDPRHPTLVVVDQLEEVFDLDDQDRAAMTHALFGSDLADGVRVLATLRPDFLEAVLVDADLRRAVSATYEIELLDDDGLRAVVERSGGRHPAPRYEEGLVDRILADARRSAAPLPLLSHTLNAMWDGAPGSIMTHAGYDARGGVGGALDQATTDWLSRVDPGVEDHLPHLFTRLVRHRPAESGGWTRRPARWSDLTPPEQQLVRGLTSVGLFVTRDRGDVEPENGDTGSVHVELAHDALFVSWKRLRDFVESEEEFLRWLEGVRYDAGRWAASDGRRDELLPDVTDVRVADRWEANHGDRLTAEQRDYLAAGRARLRRRRRRRTAWTVTGAAALVLLLVLGTVRVLTDRAAAEQVRLGESRQLADQSRESAALDPYQGAVEALAAWRTAPTDEARDRLLEEYLDQHTITRLLPAGLGSPASAAQSADGDVVVAASESGRITLYTGVTSADLRHVDVTEIKRAVGIDVAADGSRVVVGTESGAAIWFDVLRGEPGLHGPLHELTNVRERVPEPSDPDAGESGMIPTITPDGDVVVGRIWGHFVRWDLSDGRITHEASAPNTLYRTTGLDAQGLRSTVLVDPLHPTEFSDETGVMGATTVDLESGRRSTIEQGAQDWLFSGDGDSFVACREQPRGVELTRYRAKDGAELGRFVLTGKEYACLLQGIDHSGQLLTLAALSSDSHMVIDLDTGGRIASAPVPARWSSIDQVLAKAGGRYYELGPGLGDGPLQQAEVVLSGETVRRDTHRDIDHVYVGDGADVLTIANRYDGYEQRADHVVQRSVGYTGQVTATAEVLADDWALQSEDGLRVDLQGELVASHEGPGRVVLRDAATLREVSTVDIAEPAEANVGRAVTRDLTGSPGKIDETHGHFLDNFRFFFDAAGNLITVSDDLAQLWDTSDGTELGRFDLATTRSPADEGFPAVVSPAASPGHLAVSHPGVPGTTLIDLRTGGDSGILPTAPDLVALQFDPQGQYVVTLSQDWRLEVRTADFTDVVVGPVEVGSETGWTARFLDDGRFALGANSRLEIYDLSEVPAKIPAPETYRFGGPAEEIALESSEGAISGISPGGDRVLYRHEFDAPVIDVPIDPAAWTRDLCVKTASCAAGSTTP